MAYGGIAGADGRKKYGIGSFFQDVKDKFVDDIIPNEIKENPLMSSVLAGTLLNQYGVPFTGTPGDRMGQDWFSNLISGAQDKAIQQGVKPLSMHTYDSNIPQIDIRPGDVSQKVGIGDKIGGAIGNVAGALGSGIGALGSGLNWLGESAGQLIGDVAGGAGEVARKGLATILPGGDPGYVPDGLYRTAGQLLNPFSTAMAKTHPDDMIEAMKKTGITGERGVFTNTNTNKKAVPLEGWRKALATILPGGDPGYDLGKKILGGLGGLGEFAGEFLGDWGNAIMAPGTKDKANWIGPVTMGLGIGALDKATRKTDMMPQDTSGIDIPAIRAAALQGQGGAFLPPASATTAYAQGGRTGYATGDTVDQNMITAFSVYKNAGGKEDFKGWFSDIYLPEVAQQRTPYEEESAPLEEEWDIFGRPRQPVYAAQGGRIGAQEGGLMNLGGMEKDYRQEGGFVPIGGEERADDVPARLSKNEFVFTADAVRAAGGGDIDAGAEVMENLMNNLEQGGQVSKESQGLEGARDMFATAQRLEGVM